MSRVVSRVRDARHERISVGKCTRRLLLYLRQAARAILLKTTETRISNEVKRKRGGGDKDSTNDLYVACALCCYFILQAQPDFFK